MIGLNAAEKVFLALAGHHSAYLFVDQNEDSGSSEVAKPLRVGL